MAHATASDLFDEHGRCIPKCRSGAVNQKSRRYFRCHRPQHSLAEIHARIKSHLAPELTLGAEEFERRIERIRERLSHDPRTRNVLSGPALPFVLPRLEAADLGGLLDERFLPAVASAYAETFPEYAFTNHHPAGTRNCLSPRPGARHERLLAAMAESEVCGIYFPCLSEYSVEAALEQLEALPEDLLLAGGFDTSAALVGSPDLLMRTDVYAPLLWLSGLEGEARDIGYHFEPYGYNLTFNRRPHLGLAAEYWWHGLTILDAD